MKFEIGQVWIARDKSKWRILATDAPSDMPIVAIALKNGEAFNFYENGAFRPDVGEHVCDLLALDRPRREWMLEWGCSGRIAISGPDLQPGEAVTVVEKLEGDE